MSNGNIIMFGGQDYRPDPTVDKVMSMIEHDQMDPEEIQRRLNSGLALPENPLVDTTGFVTLMVPSDNGPMGEMPLELNHNGKKYGLPRNVMCKIPKELADMVMHCANIKSEGVPLTGPKEKIIAQYDFDTGQHKNFGVQDHSRFRVHVERED